MSVEYVKENVLPAPPLRARWLAAALAGQLAALLLVAHIDRALPPPRAPHDAEPTDFVAENAHRLLLNLTAIGPRVAGSYENEVVGVGVAVSALREVARTAQAHHRLEVEVYRGSGAFPLTFLDGMNHVYRDVVSVVARLSAAPPARPRPALLLNCHIDTVPDSPGASDDAAGCAVLVETVRALAAERAPLAHDLVLVLNGGEENVLQASHGFITGHRWARSVRAFINLEACGAGGREVLFQAGPHDAWLLEEYAAHAPHPFASNLAQDLFRSGLIPADTDFRIYRDHGALSGLDLAWAANGYVYHTALDVAAAVPRAALQRTGDNVLALARALLRGPHLDSPPDTAAPLPVYFDVLGLGVVRLGAGAALLAAAAAVAAALLAVRAEGWRARAELGLPAAEWARLAARATMAVAGAGAAGAAGAALTGLALHAVDARLAWYARPWLAGAVFGPAALGSAAWAGGALAPRVAGGRGWWRARLLGCGATLASAGATALCALGGLRSGFVPALWAAGGAAACAGGARRWAARWALCASGAALQTSYLGVGLARVLLAGAGRAGPAPGGLPADAAVGGAVGALCVCAAGWLLPLWAAARRRGAWLAACGAVTAAACGAALLVEPYSAAAPQRMMVFHTRRTVHGGAAPPQVEHFYWVPELDANTRRTFYKHFPKGARVSSAECERWVYCGVPYYLPVRRLLPASLRAPAPPLAPPAPRLDLRVHVRRANGTRRVAVAGRGGAAHTVLVVRLPPAATLTAGPGQAAPLEAAPEGPRRTYFYMMFDARARPWRLELHVAGGEGGEGEGELQLSVATHALSGPGKVTPPLAEVVRRLHAHTAHTAHTATTAWTIDQHIYVL